MPEMHLRQSELTWSVCGPFTKNKERTRNFKEIWDSRYIYQNELDKACFQHDMAYGDCKDLTRRSTSDKKLRGKTFNLDKNLNYDGIQHKLVLKVYAVFDKKFFF